jgi:hypothetical protein
MDSHQFDALTKRFGKRFSRRQALKGLGTGLLTAVGIERAGVVAHEGRDNRDDKERLKAHYKDRKQYYRDEKDRLKEQFKDKPDSHPGDGREWCGRVWCPQGQVCCNPSCGICTEPGGVCIQRYCNE